MRCQCSGTRRAWDPVTGRCRRCKRPYRVVIPLPSKLREVGHDRPVHERDLDPTADPGEE